MSETGSSPKKPRSSLKNPQELILKAIQDGNYEELNLLLIPGVNVNPECFFIASEKHGWGMVQILLEIDPSGVFTKTEKGETLLLLHINNIEAVRYLLDHGATEYFLHNSTSFLDYGEPVLLRALKENHVGIVELLLVKGAINSSKIAGYIARAALEVAVKHPQANVEIIQLIFKYGPALSEYQYPHNPIGTASYCNGKTALLHALDHSQPNIEIIRVLIENAADVNKLINDAGLLFRSSHSTNALHHAVRTAQCYKKEIFQFFIEEIGMDPLVRDSQGNNVFYNAVQQSLWTVLHQSTWSMFNDPFGEQMTKLRQEKNEALEYILRLPQYQQYQDEHPQTIYLRNWSLVPMFEMPQILLSPQFKQTNLITPGFIVKPRGRDESYGRVIDHLVHLQVTFYFSPVSLCINSLLEYYAVAQKYVLKFLKSLVENGFRVDEPGSISPLTLVILQYRSGFLEVNCQEKTIFKYVTCGGKVGEEAESVLVNVTKFLIEKGAHFGQHIVPFPAINASEFESLCRGMFLPDAVYAAFESACFFCLPLVLPYFAQPPLTLLLLTEFNGTALVNATFPILCKGGAIPPGSRYLNDLISHLQRLNTELKIEHLYNKFLEMHSSPPTLLHLSRCVIRSSCAERASQPGESLPKLMRSFEIPVELKDYLEMPPPKRLDAFYCDDPIMAQLANEGVQQLERELSFRY